MKRYERDTELLNKAVLELVPDAKDGFFQFPGNKTGVHMFGLYTSRAYREIREAFNIPEDVTLFEFLEERYKIMQKEHEFFSPNPATSGNISIPRFVFEVVKPIASRNGKPSNMIIKKLDRGVNGEYIISPKELQSFEITPGELNVNLLKEFLT